MNIFDINMPKDFNLFLFGDDHEGSKLRYDDGWGQLVEMMCSDYGGLKETRNYGIDHGDIIEAIMIDDPRYDGITTEGLILQQIERAKRNRLAIKKKLIAIMEGNHPLKLWKFGPITKTVCRDLGVRFGDWSSVFHYKTKGKTMFRHYATHGAWSINSSLDDPKDRKNSMCRTLRRKLQRKVGDCVLMSMGHAHRLLISKPEPDLYLTTDGGQKQKYTKPDQTAEWIPPLQRYYVVAGSFLRSLGNGYAGYAEIKGYDPLILGCAVALVRDGELVDVKEIFFK